MSHRKLISLLVLVTIFASAGGITWAFVNAQQANEQTQTPETSDTPPSNMPKLMIHEEMRDATMTYIKEQHPEAAEFITNFAWTGGRIDTNLLGAEKYVYECQGWKVTITYPVIPNPVYNVLAEYHVPEGTIGVPYSLNWQGTIENGVIAETSYCLAQ